MMGWLRKGARGSALAWTAVVLAVVVLPLTLLLIDGARILYADTRLQDATDAACEALAQASIYEQVQQFQQSGKIKPRLSYRSRRAASAVFAQTIGNDPVLKDAHPALSLSVSGGLPLCTASASVQALFLNYTTHLRAASVPSARGSRR